MNGSQGIGIVNSLTVEKGFKVLQEDRLRLQATPLHLCKALLEKMARGNYLVYPGSHHISVIDGKGNVVLSLKEIGYF